MVKKKNKIRNNSVDTEQMVLSYMVTILKPGMSKPCEIMSAT